MALPQLLGLQRKFGQLVTEQRALIDEIGDKVPAADQAEKMKRMDDDLDAMERQIEQVKKAEKRAMEEVVEENAPKEKLTQLETERRALLHYCSTGEIGEEYRSLLKPYVESERRAQATSPSTAGGVLIPTTLMPEIVKAMKYFGGIYDIANVFGTEKGNPLVIPTLDDTANLAIEIGEATAASDATDLSFGSKTFGAIKYTSGVHKVNQELIDDSSFNVEGEVLGVLGTRLARRWAGRFISGNGTSQPEGIVTALAAIGGGATGATAAAVNAITADELLDLQHSIDIAYREGGRCHYTFADTTLKALRKLKDGEGRYIWQMGDIRTKTPATIWDSPYKICNDMAAIGASNTSALYGDFNYYRIRLIGSPAIKRLTELYATSDQIGFVMFARIDAKFMLPGTIKRLVHPAS